MQTDAKFQDRRYKLLIADDEEIIRERMKDLSENLGFEVKTAANGHEAWQAFRAEQPDLVILDVYMPHMNGLMVLSKIKEVDPACPVILITGYLNYEQLIGMCDIKPDGCLIKPLNATKMGALLLKLVENRNKSLGRN